MNDVTFKQIEIFLAAAEQLSLTETAKDLYINQSAVSRWIQRLERSLNTKLFHRNNRGIELTSNGEFLYAELKPTFEKLSATLQNICNLRDMQDNTLHIGCLNSTEVVSAVREAIKAFEFDHPQIRLHVELFNFEDLREELVCGHLDSVVTYSLGFGEYWNIETKTIKRLDTYIAVSTHSPLSDSVAIPVKQLNNETLFLLYIAEMQDAEIRAIETCRKIGFVPKDIKYMPSFFALEMAVKNGKGFTICGENVCNRFGKDIKLYPVLKPHRDQFVIMAWRKNKCSVQTKELIVALSEDRTSFKEPE